ncbi:MAG: hypothetical protein ACPG8W_05745 [Candidatus Promineifilaceae bacterium]
MNDENNTLAETESFIVWTTDDQGEMAYHIELGGISLHMNTEEWDEFVTLIKLADRG